MQSGAKETSRRQKALLIVNPAAGTRTGWTPDDLARLVRSHGLEVDCVVERCASEVAADAQERGYDLVIAAGGDGTVRSVACATTLPVAILPAGTSNSVARSLGIPLDMKSAARVAATGHVADVDLGEAEGPNLREPRMSFLLCASAGFDAEAARRYEMKRRRRGSILAYAAIAVKTGLDFQQRDIRVLAEGHCVALGKMTIVSNMRHYAGWLTPAPDATPTDGLLDLVAVRSFGVFGLVGAAVDALLGLHQRPSRALVQRLASMRLESDYDLPVEIDGEPVGFLPVDIRVRAGALRMVVQH